VVAHNESKAHLTLNLWVNKPKTFCFFIEAFMSVNKSESRRIRTVSWEDPTISARDAMSISGFDYLCSIKDGKIIPRPVAVLLGNRLSQVEIGRVVLELNPSEYHYNSLASVHGSIAATLLDSAMTAAILSTLPIGLTCSTLEMKVYFVHPITVERDSYDVNGR
jgi:hypothetical protein